MSNVALNVVASAGRIPTKSVTVTDDDLLSHTHLDAASQRFAHRLDFQHREEIL